MIRGVLKKGMIEPLDPLPPEWHDGREVLIEPIGVTQEERVAIEQWADEIEKLAADIPPEDHEIIQRAIEEQRREGKEWMRREHERLNRLERGE